MYIMKSHRAKTHFKLVYYVWINGVEKTIEAYPEVAQRYIKRFGFQSISAIQYSQLTA